MKNDEERKNRRYGGIRHSFAEWPILERKTFVGDELFLSVVSQCSFLNHVITDRAIELNGRTFCNVNYYYLLLQSILADKSTRAGDNCRV